jgi:DNA modification methylase
VNSTLELHDIRPLFSFEPPGSSAEPVTLFEGDAVGAGALLGAPADLAYLDPPFASGYHYEATLRVSAGSATATVRRPAFRDPFRGRPDEYVAFLAPRLAATLDALRPGGSLYVQLDWRVAAYVRVHLDGVLGNSALRNELIWRRNPPLGRKSRAGQFGRVTDTILFYVKPGGEPTFHPQTTTRPAERQAFRLDPETGRAFRTAPRGDYSDESVRRLEAAGRIHRTRTRKIRIRYDLEPGPDGADGPTWLERQPVDSLWTDIPDAMHLPAAERTGYPTQKPERLLERVIEASSNPGDLVFDPFCGSGTALAAAVRRGRRAAGADRSPAAVETTFGRLAALGVPVRVFGGAGGGPPTSRALRLAHDGTSRLRLASYEPPAVPDWPGAREAVAAARESAGLALLAGWGVAPRGGEGGLRLACWQARDAATGCVPRDADVHGLRDAGGEARVLAWDLFGNRVLASPG